MTLKPVPRDWPVPLPTWWWDWAEWYLGRGPYRGHARDPKRRPHGAPARIPDWAWHRLDALLGAATVAPPKPKPAPQPTVRDRIVQWAKWGVAHEPAIHYTQDGRRSDWLSKPAGALPLHTDCSGFATACYRWAGAPDPNGLGYRAVGYTGTMLNHGRRVSSCKPGDLIVYGGGTGHHVVIAVEAGTDPLCVSHGSEGGPAYVRHSVERRYQPAGVAFLRFLDD
jgi:hypothetical protein